MAEAEPSAPEGVRRTLTSRAGFVQLVAVGVVLGLGINLAASALVNSVLPTAQTQALASLLLVLVSAAYLALFVLRTLHSRHHIHGMIPYLRSSKRVLPVRGYHLAEELSDTLSAAFIENKALQSAWDDEPLDFVTPFSESRGTNLPQVPAQDREGESGRPDGTQTTTYVAIMRVKAPASRTTPRSAVILREALEFCILDLLSSHLSTYFQGYDSDPGLVREYTRSDIPEILLQNRILALISEPIENRAIFVNSRLPKNPPGGEIHVLQGSDGSVYRRFDLSLPSGTAVTRPAPGILRLESRRLVVEIAIKFEGLNTALPPLFAAAFLKVSDRMLRAFEVTIDLAIRVKPWALLQVRGWKYHEWADSFSHKLKDFASYSDYLARIGWPFAVTQLYLSRPNQQRQPQPVSTQPRDATAHPSAPGEPTDKSPNQTS